VLTGLRSIIISSPGAMSPFRFMLVVKSSRVKVLEDRTDECEPGQAKE
jgi:hypothetical protein